MNRFQHYLATEFAEDYEEGRISRREALKLIASVTGSILLANSILAACAAPEQQLPTAMITLTPQPTSLAVISTNPSTATLVPTSTTAAQPTPSQAAAPYGTVSPGDVEVEGGDLEFPGDDATLLGYLARPKGDGSFPVALVCHENRGLTDHIRDVTRRLAKAGYVALAVDLLSRQGGTGTVGSENVPGALGNIAPEQFVKDFLSGWRYLQGQSFADAARLGMVGFCFGGGVTWLMATKVPELLAAVPFYGPHPPVADVPNINAAVLAIYAGRDTRINQGIPAIEEAMQQYGKIYEKVIYPDTDHAFHNDTGSRYAPEAAKDAWSRTLAWFEKYLKST